MNYEDMTKDELQAELEARGLPVSGNKDELVARLELDDAEAEGAQAEKATPEEVVAAQAKDPSGQRDPEANPQPDAVAGQPEEDDDDTSDPQNFRGAHLTTESKGEGQRPRIDESFDEPEPREVGRARTNMDQFDYELLPDGRKRKLIFDEPEDDDQE